jgi:hypothetical protein
MKIATSRPFFNFANLANGCTNQATHMTMQLFSSRSLLQDHLIASLETRSYVPHVSAGPFHKILIIRVPHKVCLQCVFFNGLLNVLIFKYFETQYCQGWFHSCMCSMYFTERPSNSKSRKRYQLSFEEAPENMRICTISTANNWTLLGREDHFLGRQLRKWQRECVLLQEH